MKQDVIIAVGNMKIAITCLLALNLVVHSGCVHPRPAGKTAPAKVQVRQLEIFSEGDKYGYKTKSGDVVIPATFDDARDFNGDLARVNLGARRTVAGLFGGSWGYIDKRGIIVIPIIYQHANDFSEGLAKVMQNGEHRYIDSSGKTVLRLSRGASGGDFSEGLAAVTRSVDAGTNRTHFTNYIDPTGKVVLSVQAQGEEFHEGMAAAKVPNPLVPWEKVGSRLYGFINRQGHWVIPPAYASAGEFSGGLAPVCVKWDKSWGTDNVWGYIDPTGKLLIDAQFNEAHPFHRGYALVHTGGRYVMYLDGPNEWRGGKWLVIDRQGKVQKTSSDWIDVRSFAEKADTH